MGETLRNENDGDLSKQSKCSVLELICEFCWENSKEDFHRHDGRFSSRRFLRSVDGLK